MQRLLFIAALLSITACHRVFPYPTGDPVTGDTSVADGPVANDSALSDSALSDLPAADGSADRSATDGPRATPGWVIVPAGTFQMGSPASMSEKEPCRYSDETPHQVTLTHSFEIPPTSVTQEAYETLMGDNPSYFASCGDTCPVESTNWSEAAHYCNALSHKGNYTACYNCTPSPTSVMCVEISAYQGQIHECPGYRLPTEAEWEFAYRAGSVTAYYNGAPSPSSCLECDAIDPFATAIAWYCGNAEERPHPVAGKDPNGWGLYDMAGNVSEWCSDWYKDDPGSIPQSDPMGPQTGEFRVVRGGSYASPPQNLRAARRDKLFPKIHYNAVGFRCIRTL